MAKTTKAKENYEKFLYECYKSGMPLEPDKFQLLKDKGYIGKKKKQCKKIEKKDKGRIRSWNNSHSILLYSPLLSRFHPSINGKALIIALSH